MLAHRGIDAIWHLGWILCNNSCFDVDGGGYAALLQRCRGRGREGRIHDSGKGAGLRLDDVGGGGGEEGVEGRGGQYCAFDDLGHAVVELSRGQRCDAGNIDVDA